MSGFQERGWRQGVALPRELAVTLIPGLGESDIAIVVSQDCDLTYSNLEIEPYFEAIVAVPISSISSDCEFGKNPRRLHLSIDGRCYELKMLARVSLPREHLLLSEPDENLRLSDRDRRLLARWMGLRYSRTSFPTEFNKRLSGKAKQLRRAMKKCEAVAEIYLNLDQRELKSDEDYEVVMVGRVRDARAEESDLEVRRSATEQLDTLSGVISSCGGVRVLEHALRTGHELTVAELEELDRWDVDYFSEDEGPN